MENFTYMVNGWMDSSELKKARSLLHYNDFSLKQLSSYYSLKVSWMRHWNKNLKEQYIVYKAVKFICIYVCVCNNLCIVYVHGIPYTDSWITMSSFAVSSSDSVSIVLPVTGAFVTSAKNSLSRPFVTSTMNHAIFLESNKIMCTLKT